MAVSLPFEYKRRRRPSGLDPETGAIHEAPVYEDDEVERQPMDERLPDGTPAMQVGMRDWLRPGAPSADDQEGEQSGLIEELARRRQTNPDAGFTPRASGETRDVGFERREPGAVPALAGDAAASPATWLTDEMKRRGGPSVATQMERSEGRADKTQPRVNPSLPPARATEPPLVYDGQPIAAPGATDAATGTGNPLLDEMRARQMGKPPVMIRRDKRGRPESAVGAESPLEGNKELLQATRDYQPQKAKGWKERVLIPIITGFLGGARNGDPLGGLGGVAANLGLNAAFPKAGDENWKARRERELAGNVDRDLQTERTEAQTTILKQTPELKDREQDRKEARDAALKDQQEWDRRFKSGKQASAENYIQWKMSNGDRRAQTAEGQLELRREYQELYRDFQTRRLDLDERRQKVDEEMKRAELALSKQRESRIAAGGGGAAGATATSEQEQQYWNDLADAYAEKSKDAMGVGQYSASEDYDALAKRARTKSDDIGGKRARAGGAGGAGGTATTYKYTEADVRARAKAKGKSEDAAVELARKNNLIPPK